MIIYFNLVHIYTRAEGKPMCSIQSLCKVIGINQNNFTKEENIFIEAALFAKICGAVNDVFKGKYQTYFRLMKLNIERENTMLDANFFTCITKDILSTGEYNIMGIAKYTDMPRDVIDDLIMGRNKSPSFTLCRKIIDLHMAVRPHLYASVMKKFAAHLPK